VLTEAFRKAKGKAPKNYLLQQKEIFLRLQEINQFKKKYKNKKRK